MNKRKAGFNSDDPVNSCQALFIADSPHADAKACSICGETKYPDDFAKKDRYHFRNFCTACRRAKRKLRTFDEDTLLVEIESSSIQKDVSKSLFSVLKDGGFLARSDNQNPSANELLKRRNRIAEFIDGRKEAKSHV